MKTTNIKGKEYVEVAERVKYFRQAEEYKGWAIRTELISNHDGVCVFEANIYNQDGRLMASGHAYEKEDSSFINKTSYIENCETSAVGRALGFLGIGIDASIASADEVQNAINNQPNQSKPSKSTEVGIGFDKIRQEFSTLSNEELTKKFFAVKGYGKYTDKQKETICKIIQEEIDSRKEDK